MNYTVIDNTGEIVSLLTCLEVDLAANTPDGCKAIPGHYSGKYLDGGTWFDCPTKPDGLGLVYNRQSHQWVTDPQALAEEQATQARQARQLAYQKTINDDVEYKGNIYQADEKSYENMLKVYQSALITDDEVRWKLKNNEWVDLSLDDLKELIRMIHRRNQRAFEEK